MIVSRAGKEEGRRISVRRKAFVDSHVMLASKKQSCRLNGSTMGGRINGRERCTNPSRKSVGK